MNDGKEFTLIEPTDLSWRPSNMMHIPNADYLERTGSKMLGARLWRLPPGSANTWHRHPQSEECYFVLEGVGRIRVNAEVLTVPKYGAVHVPPQSLRQVFNDSDTEVLWLVIGAPDDECLPAQGGNPEDFYPEDPRQLPNELKGVAWPPA